MSRSPCTAVDTRSTAGAHELLALHDVVGGLRRDVRHERVPGGVDAAGECGVVLGRNPFLVPQVVPLHVGGVIPGPPVALVLRHLVLFVKGRVAVGHVPVLPLPVLVVLHARLRRVGGWVGRLVTRLAPPQAGVSDARRNHEDATTRTRTRPEGIYRSSLDALKPPNPTQSEEYQRHLQGCVFKGSRVGLEGV
eukprot:1187383-Prorocentrum_minimum.AAC.2